MRRNLKHKAFLCGNYGRAGDSQLTDMARLCRQHRYDWRMDMGQIFEYAMVDAFFFASVLIVVQYKRGKVKGKKSILFYLITCGFGFLIGTGNNLIVSDNVGAAISYLTMTMWSFAESMIVLLSKDEQKGKKEYE